MGEIGDVTRALSFLIGGLGVGAAVLIGLPLPFLFGPMFACLFAALAGVNLGRLGALGNAARTILGVAIGASVTPAVVATLPGMMVTLSFIPIYLALIAVIGVPYFSRVCRFDPVTAYYAAMPGGLQDMVLFGAEAGGDVRALSLIHATRVFVLVTLAPLVLVWGFGATLDTPIGAPLAALPLADIAWMVFAGGFGWWAAARIGLFGASILGPLIMAAGLSLSGVITQRPPAESILLAQFLIGTTIGTYYVGISWGELRRDVASGVGYVIILAALAADVAEAAILLGIAPPVEAFLAFAPGGQAEMTVLAIVAGADLGFVIAHHLSRIVLVIIGAPVVARLLRGRTGGARGDGS